MCCKLTFCLDKKLEMTTSRFLIKNYTNCKTYPAATTACLQTILCAESDIYTNVYINIHVRMYVYIRIIYVYICLNGHTKPIYVKVCFAKCKIIHLWRLIIFTLTII